MITSEVGIRRAVAVDVLQLEAVRAESLLLFNRSRDLAVSLEEPGIFTYLAEDAQVFGFVTVGGSTDFGDAATGEIREWYVRRDYEHQGFGRKLLVHGMSVLKRRLCDEAVIWLPTTATRALAVILAQGFEPGEAVRTVNAGDSSREEIAYRKNLDRLF